MTPRYDIIVVGVGAMGSAACYHLARRGAKVLGIEQFDIGHSLGSSGGETRLIRKAYYEHPDYVPLLQRAYDLWDNLCEESDEHLLVRTGMIYAGPPDGELISGSLRAAKKYNIPHESPNYDQAMQRFSPLQLLPNHVAIFEPEGGFLLSERAVAAMARQADEHGAKIRGNQAVTEWSADSQGVTVRTTNGEYRAGQIIFTAGAWTAKLLTDLNVELSVTRQTLGWVSPTHRDSFALDSSPCWAVEHGDGLFYGIPILEGADSMKVAYHHRGSAADADTLDRTPNSEDEKQIRDLLQQYLSGANSPLDSMHICMYTYSPDGHFILGRHPGKQNVWFAGGFSGHGFKFAPVIGEALADLALNGKTDLPIDFLSPNRFE